MNTNIFTICGDSGPMPDFEKIKSDPNFIFEADPNFLQLHYSMRLVLLLL